MGGLESRGHQWQPRTLMQPSTTVRCGQTTTNYPPHRPAQNGLTAAVVVLLPGIFSSSLQWDYTFMTSRPLNCCCGNRGQLFNSRPTLIGPSAHTSQLLPYHSIQTAQREKRCIPVRCSLVSTQTLTPPAWAHCLKVVYRLKKGGYPLAPMAALREYK